MKKACVCIAIVMALVLCGCASTQGGTQGGFSGTEASTTATHHEIAHRYASASEACDPLLSNDRYYAGFSQNDLDFRIQKHGATMEEYKRFAAEQTRDFTDKEKEAFDGLLAKMATTLTERGYTLPPLDEVTFVKTTMAEECMADNFSYAMTFGKEGLNGSGYKSPEIIEGIISRLS